MDPQKGTQHGHHNGFSWTSTPAQQKAAPAACLGDDALDHLPLACPLAPGVSAGDSCAMEQLLF